MSYMLTPLVNGTGLSAPVRNRYFYGKLLDAYNLQMEQQYFLEMGRLMNRLTLGSGVLCGLGVSMPMAGTVTVSPGVAVDGQGREIVVTEPVTFQLSSLEGGTEANLNDMVLCIAYHECDVDPAPVLVADCDLRQECVPGAVRERYQFQLIALADAPMPEDPCGIWGLRRVVVADPLPAQPMTPALQTQLEQQLAQSLAQAGTIGLRTPATAAQLRQRLCGSFQPPCAAGPDCVPIAQLATDQQGTLQIEPCPPRRTIYSNAVLLDLILCLMETVERCCQQKTAVNPPRVSEIWPTPHQTVKLAQFQTRIKLSAGIAISFERPMNAERLKQPDAWLRLAMLTEKPDRTAKQPTMVVQSTSLALKLAREEAKTISGKSGQTAVYEIVGELTIGAAGSTVTPHTLASLLDSLGVNRGWVLVLMRSDDVTQIAAANDAELLDADFSATDLTSEICDLMWMLHPGGSTTSTPALLAAVAGAPSPMPKLPSGNGIPGGVFHSSFQITLG